MLVLPGSMPFRNVVGGGLLEELSKKTDRSVVVICPDESYRKELPDHVEWRDLRRPSKSSNQPLYRRVVRSFSLRIEFLLNITYAGLAYRFNEISGFKAHQFKKKMPRSRRLREAIAGNFVSRRYGFPFPTVRFIYRLISRIYYRQSYISDRFIEGFFDDTSIDLIVFWYSQNDLYRDYVQCARSRSIPMVAAIGSWDRVTTKGPLMPDLAKVIAINQVMKSELIEYHDVFKDDIVVVGWLQMDNYIEPKSKERVREPFLSKCGSDSDAIIVVFACNSERLGRHEPSIVRDITESLSTGAWARDVCFFVRPHPRDTKFKERFSAELEHKSVHWGDASMTNLSQLKDLFLCADVVICTQGSITLDAIAFDCCVINVAFDGDLEPAYEESVQRYYEMDHFQSVVDSGGVVIVRDHQQLDRALRAYVANTSLHAQSRVNLRTKMLDPLDGGSTQRIVDVLLNEL